MTGASAREGPGVGASVAFDLVPLCRRSRCTWAAQLHRLWFSATSGAHVGFESWLERDHLTLLDFDPLVVGMASQPFWLCGKTAAGGGRTRRTSSYGD
jgi:hypothetical protein